MKFFNLRGSVVISVLLATLSAVGAVNSDPFLWLEEIRSDAAINWVNRQNQVSLGRLESQRLYQEFESEARAIFTAKDRIPTIRKINGLVYNFWQDQDHVQGILRRTSLQDYESVNPTWEGVLDLDLLSKTESTLWVYRGMDCVAPRYERCLVSLSRGGKDAVVVREFDLNKKEFVSAGFELPESKLSVSWIDENTLIVATDFGLGTLTRAGYPRQARLLRRGESLQQAKLVYEGLESDTGIFVSSAQSNTLALVTRSIDFFRSETRVLSTQAAVKLWPVPVDAQLLGIGRDYAFYSTRTDWVLPSKEVAPSGSLVVIPRQQSIGLDLGKAEVAWRPNSRTSLQGIAVSRDYALVNLRQDVRSRIFRLDRGSSVRGHRWTLSPLGLPDTGLISVSAVFDRSNQGVLSFQDFLTPPTTYLVDFSTLTFRKLKSTPDRFDARGLQIKQRFSRSSDGVDIPYFLIGRKNLKLDGSNPTILYGYGGFMVPVTPYYLQVIGKSWLERGGVYVVANIRGGGEYGPAWHEAARKEKRQTAFNDFYSVAEDLIERKVTSPKNLGIEGASNGGLLVGVAFTQRPELFNAVSCSVPLLDMLRFHRLLAGASWISEYGNPDIPSERAILQKYSPYENLQKSIKYPEVFFTGSTADDRVHPGHARKMAAKMEAMGLPFLFYENTDGGHGGAANLEQRVKIQALQLSYFSERLGLK
ncbi:MAG: prolyl oligopeptidase family serine peptidase [Bdellovibrionales bacterium]|nr:prolyl oligopeptidase family serine peptidase [Bdellovibrionales bacterium]